MNTLSSRKPIEKASLPLIVQARVESTRYPGKIVQPFAGGQALLEFQLCRLKAAFPDSPIVVATSSSAADDVVAGMAEDAGVLVYRGDERDVLKRFVDCCAYFSFTGYVVRVCGDNPFLQTALLDSTRRHRRFGQRSHPPCPRLLVRSHQQGERRAFDGPAPL